MLSKVRPNLRNIVQNTGWLMVDRVVRMGLGVFVGVWVARYLGPAQRQVFERIREARPRRLYIAADGPRSTRSGEAEKCAEVRAIATNVDWPCEVKTLFQDQNLGCKVGVASGITWFFEQEVEGIILEDDVLPVSTLFKFFDEMLERYRNDDRIAIINGSNLISAEFR